ncbi:MAG: 2-hydroxyacyl-CoA dehydratase, partial [bacterium]|nr:2-hydroxyacyl-CoA dehydratase [bacterium]
LLSLADGLLNASLIGTSKTRAKGIIQQVKDYNAEGVIISNIFASSHCAYETYLIKEYLRKEIDIPLLSFDVVAPGKKMQQSQILNRMAAFIEIIKEKRRM